MASVQGQCPWCPPPTPVSAPPADTGNPGRASPLPAGLRVRLGGPAGPKPSQPVQRLQEHAFVAPARPQERLCGALRGECEAAPSLPFIHHGGGVPEKKM